MLSFEPLGAIISITCILIMVYLYRNYEALENGNIDQ